jgi:hypothetical protein
MKGMTSWELTCFAVLMAILYVSAAAPRPVIADPPRQYVPCEAIPKAGGAVTKRLRYDPATGHLINVATGEIE